MEVAAVQFSEQAVQEELERIRTEHLERGEFQQAAQLCEALIQKYPQSKWAGNAYLAAARCYHELGRNDEEARTLEAFLTAFPQHVQAVTVRRALEDLQRRYQQQVHDGEHPTALQDVEGRLQRLYEGLHDLKQRQEHLEELSRSVSSLAGQVDELKAKAQLLAADLEGESGEPTVLELVNALIQDLRTELDSQRKRTDARLVGMNAAIEDLKTRFGSGMRVVWASVAALLVAFAILIVSVFQSQPPGSAAASGQAAARPSRVHARIFRVTSPPVQAVPKAPASSHKKAEPRAVAKAAAPRTDAATPPATVKNEQPAKAAQPAQPAVRTYKVKPGDTLWGICSKVLGNTKAVDQVIAINGLKGPNYSLRSGQTLRLPAPTPSKSD